MTKNSSHPPEHYAELRERLKLAGVKEKRFKILATDVAQAEEMMAPLVDRALEAKKKITDNIREADRMRATDAGKTKP